MPKEATGRLYNNKKIILDNNSGTTDTINDKNKNNIVKVKLKQNRSAKQPAEATSHVVMPKRKTRPLPVRTDTPRPSMWGVSFAPARNQNPLHSRQFCAHCRLPWVVRLWPEVLSYQAALLCLQNTQKGKSRGSSALCSPYLGGCDVGVEMIKLRWKSCNSKDNNNKSRKSNHHPIDEHAMAVSLNTSPDESVHRGDYAMKAKIAPRARAVARKT